MPYTSLINNYDNVSKQCKTTSEPIFLIKNDKCDLVVMDVDTFERKQALLNLKERLLNIEFEQKNGARYYSIEELNDALKKALNNK